MKRLIINTLSIVILVISFHQANSQSFGGQIIAGLNVSQIDGDDIGGFDKAGLLLGGAVTFPLSEKVQLQPEILYSQKGSRSRENEPFFIWKLNYIDIPITVNYIFKEKYVFQGGLGGNYLLAANSDTGFGFQDETELFSKVDFTAHLGVDFLVFENLSLRVRWTNSLKNMAKEYYYFNKVLSFAVCYRMAGK
ncbi:outer membrane beta-barrel protein [Flexithrix dorotheae]|uniref:outer membrane beta-barrel protein n=1 Tax=Flexithrix dorotheae TaxID=70993 RepID=UPI0003737B15|nr:outer membrane beta-barrel protein [Flexithrix dorotheae]